MAHPDPTFPPLLTGKAVTAPKRPFATACEEAMAGSAGAGDIYWARNNRTLDFAIILEPEVSLNDALQVPYVVMVGFGDAFGVLAPPETGLHFLWPDRILVNGAEVGNVKIAVPNGFGGDDVPDWIVIGITVEVENDDRIEPGDRPDVTTLFEEGCAEITCQELLEASSRHILAWIHNWEQDGFRQVHDAWVGRAWGYDEDTTAEIIHKDRHYQGHVMGLDQTGSLLLKQNDETVSLDLKQTIQWIDG